jgi:hypothetical protein
MVVGIGDRDGQGRAEADAVFRTLDPNPIVPISVHGIPRGAWRGLSLCKTHCHREPLRALLQWHQDAPIIGRMLQSLAKFSEPKASNQTPSFGLHYHYARA